MPTITTNAHAISGTITRLNHPGYQRWADQIRRAGGCRQPIHLRGKIEHRDRLTGALLHRYSTYLEPDGVLRLPCKTRRASRCPACAEIYRADTYHLIRAGLVGGKGVPTSVTSHPCLFLTLTAPSFGVVHTRLNRNGKLLPCHARRNPIICTHGQVMSCTARHGSDEQLLGEPLCALCYDYSGSVLFNAYAPLLWKRFTDALRRNLAKRCGLTLKGLREQLVVSFAKVAEYQRRGLVHFHAIVRLDGPNGPQSAPPAWATIELLGLALQHAASVVQATVPAYGDHPDRVLRWGNQLDIRPITLNGELTEQAVAGYVAKYAVKGAESIGILDCRILPTTDLAALPVREHARQLIAACVRLGALDELADLRLIQWAHMLGFRGHFSTRSRHYSVTITDIRAGRATHARRNDITTDRLPLFPEDTPRIVATWRYVGRGLSLGDALIADSLGGAR
ncbi:replication initiation protein [Acrocarpospora corrugata]|uniref:Replication initiation protein n=1 Tax=Acrocarpospora corrugata TaxID=35763 RepID=A0A5M3WA76_9ACTN|nr:replication initiator [Acrocarpospora corrugata]GES05140.1 replication initiation protein [Acrocarpospora corrugata]